MTAMWVNLRMISGRKVEAGREDSFQTFPSQLEDVDVGAKDGVRSW